MARDTVITGLGAVTGLGVGAGVLWEGLGAGRSAIGPITAFDASGFPSSLAAEVRDYKARDYVPKSYRKAVKVMARDIELAVGAALGAVEDAGIITRGTADDGREPTFPGDRIGCQIGAGFIACDTPEIAMAQATARADDGGFSLERWGTEGMNNLSPLWLLKYLPNMLACHVTIIHNAQGPSNTITCGEASGLLSIGESRRVIERGDADICFSGGAESKVNPMGLLRMHYAGRLFETGEATDASGRILPFDPASSGSVLGEGAGIVLIESAESASARGARVHARVAGFGAAQSLDDDAPGDGLATAVRTALADAGMTPADIDLIVPHASGAPACDTDERAGLVSIFGARLDEIHLVALPPAIGDVLAGAGGVAACVAATALREQQTPVGEGPVRAALVCTNAMGGQNAALVLTAP